jgi:hypothetical protein
MVNNLFGAKKFFFIADRQVSNKEADKFSPLKINKKGAEAPLIDKIIKQQFLRQFLIPFLIPANAGIQFLI